MPYPGRVLWPSTILADTLAEKILTIINQIVAPRAAKPNRNDVAAHSRFDAYVFPCRKYGVPMRQGSKSITCHRHAHGDDIRARPFRRHGRVMPQFSTMSKISLCCPQDGFAHIILPFPAALLLSYCGGPCRRRPQLTKTDEN